jgi:hypothetical protein
MVANGQSKSDAQPDILSEGSLLGLPVHALKIAYHLRVSSDRIDLPIPVNAQADTSAEWYHYCHPALAEYMTRLLTFFDPKDADELFLQSSDDGLIGFLAVACFFVSVEQPLLHILAR